MHPAADRVKLLPTMETPEQKNLAIFDQIFRFIIIGDAAVGKSCLLLQFTDHKFRSVHDPTIGVDSGSRIITIDDGKRTKLSILDPSGREESRHMTRSFYSTAAAAILVYDVTRRETFDHVGAWLAEAKERAPANLTVVLVGNKCDLAPQEQRAVSYEEGRLFAKEHKLDFMEASARTNRNVEEVFFAAARIVAQKLEDGVIDESARFGGLKLRERRGCIVPPETVPVLQLTKRIDGDKCGQIRALIDCAYSNLGMRLWNFELLDVLARIYRVSPIP